MNPDALLQAGLILSVIIGFVTLLIGWLFFVETWGLSWMSTTVVGLLPVFLTTFVIFYFLIESNS